MTEEITETINLAQNFEFEPKIVAYCCHYCAYNAADLAGTRRLVYPANVRIVRIPCSGRIDILYILRAFEKGADGVYVAGCEIGDCHFKKGNLHAKQRVKRAKELLDEIGVGGERVEMYYIAASKGQKFAEVAREMTEKIRKLGPSPVNLIREARSKGQVERGKR